MIATRKPLVDRTAADLMSPVGVRLNEGMPLREAAQALVRAGVNGAPVVDAAGRCVGVLSASDLVRWALRRTGPVAAHPRTCAYQDELRGPTGEQVTRCTLPPGRCPYQSEKRLADGRAVLACREPHALCLEWQMVDLDALPTDDVRRYMTAEPVTVGPDARIGEIARLMTNAEVHRVVVVDPSSRPIGVVSGSDLVAAVGAAAGRQPIQTPEGRSC